MKKSAFWIFNDDFAIPTFLSVASFIEHCDEEVNLIYYGGNLAATELLFSRLEAKGGINIEAIESDFFSLPIFHFNKDYTETIKNRELLFWVADKACEDRIIFLFDSDMVFSKDITKLFAISTENIQNYTLCGNIEWQTVEDNTLFFFREDGDNFRHIILKEEKIENYQLIYGDKILPALQAPIFNTGVLILRNTTGLASKWKELYKQALSFPNVNPKDDQTPLALACAILKVNILPLSDKFNSKGQTNGDYAVFHGYAGKWREVLTSIMTDLPFVQQNLSDYAQICKSKLSLLRDISHLKAIYLPMKQPYLYCSIDGWLFSQQLYRHIIHHIPAKGIFVEIGTYTGKSICFAAELVSQQQKSIRLISIDDYKNKNIIYGNFLDFFERKNLSMEQAQTNLEQRNLLDLITLINQDAQSSLSQFEEESVDFVCFTMDLTFDMLRENLDGWYKKLKKGGYLTGIDYISTESARNAVNAFCEAEGLSVISKYGCFIIEKK